MKINVAGDFCPRERVADKIKSGAYKELFADIKEYNETADYSLVNFESPVYEGDFSRHTVKWGSILHAGFGSVKALSYSGFNGVTLANNHFLDYGEEGAQNTIKEIKNEGLDYVGGGHNLQESSEILYKSFEDGTLAIINCCENEFSIAGKNKCGSNPLSPISLFYKIKEAKKHANYVLVICHGGHEYYQLPSPRMQDLYRFFVDCGASAVVNHHQHCYSGYEYYHGCPIIYGLGNFSFDRSIYRDEIWNKGYIVQINFDFKISIELYPYIQSDEHPGTISMSKYERSQFFKIIEELNDVINNREELENRFFKFTTEKQPQFESMFEPWGKGFRYLWKRGFLPSLITKKKWLCLADYIMCESHYDVLKEMLKNKVECYSK